MVKTQACASTSMWVVLERRLCCCEGLSTEVAIHPDSIILKGSKRPTKKLQEAWDYHHKRFCRCAQALGKLSRRAQFRIDISSTCGVSKVETFIAPGLLRLGSIKSRFVLTKHRVEPQDLLEKKAGQTPNENNDMICPSPSAWTGLLMLL